MMNTELLSRTLEKNGMTARCLLEEIDKALRETADIEGDVVELGCFRGRTTRFICEILQELDSKRVVHAYDGFEGLPAAEDEDADSTLILPTGGCKTPLQGFLDTFACINFPMPIVHKGWFEDTLPQELPEKISFAFLDSDRYSSMKLSLDTVVPRMSSGGIMIMHDYLVLSGAKQAVDEHLDSFKSHVSQNNQFIARL